MRKDQLEKILREGFVPFAQANGYRADAAASAFTSRDLEAVLARSFDIKFPDLKHRQFIPTLSEVPAGAETVTYEQWNQVASAEFLTNNGDDIPMADVSLAEFSRPTRMIASGFGWNYNEMLNAAFGNRPLTQKRQSAARRAVEEKLENIACFGASAAGITEGFLNHSAVAVQNLPVGAGADEEWTLKTPDEILADVGSMWDDTYTGTLETETPTTLAIPTTPWVHINTTRLVDTGDTIMSFLRKAYPGLEIMPWFRLNTAGAAGEGRAVMYRRDPEVVRHDLPLDFTQLAPQERGLAMVVPCLAKTAGVSIQYPKAVNYYDKIS